MLSTGVSILSLKVSLILTSKGNGLKVTFSTAQSQGYINRGELREMFYCRILNTLGKSRKHLPWG